MSALLGHVKKEPALITAITSIGFDGENFDNVTGLPKPRVDVWEGCFVAVAEKCFQQPAEGEARLKVLSYTDIVTPLGRVAICRVVEDGKLVLAGPVSSKDLRTVLELFSQLGVRLAVVDGALSRIAPMSEVDGVILAQGAAKNTDIKALALESKYLIEMLGMPVLEETGKCGVTSSVLSDSVYPALANRWAEVDTLRVAGVVGETYLSRLAGEGESILGKRLIFPDPTKLLVAGETERVHVALQRLWERGAVVGVEKSLRPLAMTVNPFYPSLRYSRDGYEPAYVDRDALFSSISSHVGIPCFNIFVQGGEELFRCLREEIALHETR